MTKELADLWQERVPTKGALIDYANDDFKKANPTRWETPRGLPLFDGPTFEEKHDAVRLAGQLAKVYNCMSDGRWRTLAEIRAFIQGGSEAGISARLRDLRKVKWGNQTVNRRRRGESTRGTYEYQLIVNQ